MKILEMINNPPKPRKMTQVNSFTFKTDNPEDQAKIEILQKDFKEHRDVSDKLSILKTVNEIDSKSPEIIRKYKKLANSVNSPNQTNSRNAKFWSFMSSLPSIDQNLKYDINHLKNFRTDTINEQASGFSRKPTMAKTSRMKTGIISSPTKGKAEISYITGRTIRR